MPTSIDPSLRVLLRPQGAAVQVPVYAFVVLPGGLGTLDELFEALTLIQTGKIESFPVVLIGRTYWAPLVELLHQMVMEQHNRCRRLEAAARYGRSRRSRCPHRAELRTTLRAPPAAAVPLARRARGGACRGSLILTLQETIRSGGVST